jgi:hypothetical protein
MCVHGLVQLTFYTKFMEQTQNMQINLQAFERLKPWFIKKFKKFNCCCCNYHVQMVELKYGYNSMLIRIFHQDYTCTYDVYGSHGETTCVANNIVVT